MDLKLFGRSVLVLDDFQHLAVFAADDAPVSLGIRHDCRKHRRLCPRLHVFFMEACKQLCCEQRCVTTEHHDRSMFARQEILRLQNGVSRPELLLLLHILNAVANGLSHGLAAKSCDDNIAPRTGCICRINDMLKHGFSRRTMQYLRQL